MTIRPLVYLSFLLLPFPLPSLSLLLGHLIVYWSTLKLCLSSLVWGSIQTQFVHELCCQHTYMVDVYNLSSSSPSSFLSLSSEFHPAIFPAHSYAFATRVRPASEIRIRPRPTTEQCPGHSWQPYSQSYWDVCVISWTLFIVASPSPAPCPYCTISFIIHIIIMLWYKYWLYGVV